MDAGGTGIMGNIWTVAKQTIAESIRMKIAVFFVVLLGILVLGLPFASQGDGSISGAVQSFLSYSMAATSFLLACLTIFLAKSLSDDLVGKQIQILMTKPLARWQYVLGKWFGIVLVNAVLLSVSGTIIYGMTMYVASKPPRDALDRERLENQVLQARHAARCVPPTSAFRKGADTLFEERLEQGRYSDVDNLNVEKEKGRLRKEIARQYWTVPPLGVRAFDFEDVRCDRSPDTLLHMRYEYRVQGYPPDEIIRLHWVVGDREKGAQAYDIPRRDAMDRAQTLTFPADAVASDNTLRIILVNENPYVGQVPGEVQYAYGLYFDSPDKLEVLFSVSSFWSNLLRTLCLVMCRLAFIAAVAITATTAFSFPVASLVSMAVYVLVGVQKFLSESVQWMPSEGSGGFFQVVLDGLLRGLYFLVPNFATYDGLPTLVEGRNVTLMWVLLGVGNLVVLKTGILLILACLLFQRREVSEISL